MFFIYGLVKYIYIFLFAALRTAPLLLSSSILYVLGHDDELLGVVPKNHGSQDMSQDKRFALVNINYNRLYYRQYLKNTYPNTF